MYELRVDLGDFDGQTRFAEYSDFSISPATDKYRLNLGNYTGDAGLSAGFLHNNNNNNNNNYYYYYYYYYY